jgi:hypothetical protein
VGPLMVTLLFVIVSVGALVLSARDMQSVAVKAARCGAAEIPGCMTIPMTQSYARTMASGGFLRSATPVFGVSAVGGLPTCGGMHGYFYQVTINWSYFAFRLLPVPWNNSTIAASACSPMALP